MSQRRRVPSVASRKCLVRSLSALRSDAPVWLQGVMVRSSDDALEIDDGSGVAVVSTALLDSLDRPGVQVARSLHVGAYVLVVGQFVRVDHTQRAHVRASTVRSLAELGPMAESMWHLELADAYLRSRTA